MAKNDGKYTIKSILDSVQKEYTRSGSSEDVDFILQLTKEELEESLFIIEHDMKRTRIYTYICTVLPMANWKVSTSRRATALKYIQNNKPTAEKHPEFYNHPNYDKEQKSTTCSWWVVTLPGHVDYKEQYIINTKQRIAFLDMLIRQYRQEREERNLNP